MAGFTLFITASLLAPSIFKRHMQEAGIDSSAARMHISEAFTSAFVLSLAIAMAIAFVVAGIFALYLMRRIAQPIESLAIMAEALSSGESLGDIEVKGSTPEIDRLALALTGMSTELSKVREDQSRMLRDLAHELRTPITTVGAIIDGIEDGVIEGNTHSWNTVRDQLQRLNRLSRDVSDVSHSYDQSLSNVRVKCEAIDIASAAISTWSLRFETKGIHLEMQISSDIPPIEVDPDRIGQVLSNLLENALRHTPKGGTVQLSIEKVENQVSFSVSDSGEGIAPHQLPHIFQRLYRGDSARHSGDSGSGLGLTIARSIADSHSGTLVAASRGRGQGSTFTLTIPIH
jgi:signal transduction histidine kinase